MRPHRAGDPFHGTNGPLHLTPAGNYDRINQIFVDACQQAGACRTRGGALPRRLRLTTDSDAVGDRPGGPSCGTLYQDTCGPAWGWVDAL